MKIVEYIKNFRRSVLNSYVKYRKPKFGLNKNKRDVPIIVSLTSYPKRFPYIKNPLKSILFQTIKPSD